MCGSFDNWETKHEMKKDIGRSVYFKSVEIGKNGNGISSGNSKIYYKFIINNEWKTSENDKIEIDDVGNSNNFIILSNDNSEDDRFSEFTSISYPSSYNKELENDGITTDESLHEFVQCKKEENPPEIEEDLTSSVQITLKDNSSVSGSIGCTTSSLLSNSKNKLNTGGSGGGVINGDSSSVNNIGSLKKSGGSSINLSKLESSNQRSIISKLRNMFHN